MPVYFDSPAKGARGVVFDAPKSGVVFDEEPKSPYADVVAEMVDFERRAAKNTPEAIGRAAVIDDEQVLGDTPIQTGFGPAIPLRIAKPLIENTPRVALPLGAAMSLTGVGTLPGLGIMALAGAGGELASQALEKEFESRESFSPTQIATGGLLSMAPPLRLAGVASPVARAGLRTLEGAGYGAAAPVVEAGLRGELPQIQDVGTGALFGGVLGAPFGALELGRGRTLGGRPATDIAPTELGVQGQLLREPVLPPPTDIAPLELEQIRFANELAASDATAARAANERSVANLDAGIDAEKVRRLGERMMGKSPQDQLSILDQELKLAGDTLSLAEQRAGLDMKIALKKQIEQQKALENAAAAEQKAIKEAEAVQAQAQKDAQAALTPPEPPKSQQILEEASAPKALANVATEVATQTKQSPYALQAGLNKMTQVEAPQPTMPQVEPRAPIQPGEPIEAAIERLAANGETALAIAARTNSSVKEVRRIAMEKGYAIAEKSKVKPDIVMTPMAAPAEFIGIQEGIPGKVADIELYNLTQDIPGHNAGSTVARETLEKAGFEVPKVPKSRPVEAEVYHGATQAFNDGDIKRPAFFSDDKKVAERFAKSRAEHAGEDNPSPRVIAGKVKFRNPLIIDAEGDFAGNIQFGPKSKEYRAALDDQRYDGIVIRNTKDEGNLYIAKSNSEFTPKNAAPAPAPQTAELRLNNADLDLPPLSSLNAKQKLAELKAAGITEYKGKPIEDANPAQLSAALGQHRRGQLGSESGRFNPSALNPIATTITGAAYGITEGDSAEERIRNAALYGALGLGAGVVSTRAINRLLAPPIRNYKSQALKDVSQMLTPLEEKTGLFDKLSDGYNNFRYRFNTRFAPIGQAQRDLYKWAGKTFTPSRYYDLERGFERLAGAPVQAEGEVELLQNVIDKLPKQDVPHLDTYLTLARIDDRLVKTSEENARLQDAVGIAQAELDAAQAANTGSPGVRNASAVVARREALKQATNSLKENFDRKRVGDWSITKARQGLSDLEAEIGPEAFARLKQAGQEYQDVMRRSLQIQVDSGRMEPDLMQRILESNDFYAPFKVLKYFEDGEGFVKGGGLSRIPSSEQLAKKITGIDDLDVRIGSPTNVAAEQVYKGYILAQKNRKLRELATLERIDPDGDYVRSLAPDIEPRRGYEAVTYFVGGKPKRMEVSRPIAEALGGLDEAQTGVILGGLSNFSKVFKLGATGLNATFNIANSLVFDPLRLATMSRYGFRGPQDFIYTAYEWPKALFSSARGNLGQAMGFTPGKLYDEWIRSGAANSTLSRQLAPEAFASRMPKDAAAGEAFAEANTGLGVPIKVSSLISNTLEETTKLLGLQRAKRIERLDKLSPQERTKKWDEIVTEIRNYSGSPDFARMGVDMRPLNIILPFLNARWQGALADTARLNPFRQGNAKDAGAAWARLGSLVALPAGALAYYNMSTPQNEEDYLKIPKSERERYFHVPINIGPDGEQTILETGKGYYFKNKDGVEIRGYYRIPKREIPGLIANTMEDFMQYAKSEHPESFPELMKNLGENTAQTLSPLNIEGDTLGERAMSAMSGVNPAIRLPVEIGFNQNAFTGQPIVPKGQEKASPEKQYSERTPQPYRSAAEAMPDAAPDVLRSPARLQHITEGLTGGFSRQFASPRLSKGNPAGETSPILGRFYRSERVESEDLLRGADDAERGRTDQRLDAQRLAGKIADVIASKPTPEAKQKALSDAVSAGLLESPDVQSYLKEDLVDAARGLTYEDRVVKRSYSVAGGFRARYYAERLAALPAEQRAAYLQDQFQKGLLSKEVGAQLAALLRPQVGDDPAQP